MSYDPITWVDSEIREVLLEETRGSTGAFSTIVVPTGIYDYIEVDLDAKSSASAGGDIVSWKINADATAANYSWQLGFFGQAGSTAHTATGGDAAYCGRIGANTGANHANAFSPNRMIINGISDTNRFTTVITHAYQQRVANSTDNYGELWLGSWENTANVTAIIIDPVTGSFLTGSYIRAVGVRTVRMAKLV
jgi:hypothetical protein